MSMGMMKWYDRGEYRESVDFAVAAWLHAKRQRSGSERTVGEYARKMSHLRRALRAVGTDLDGDIGEIALVIQAWVGGGVSGATANARLATAASFYRYCRTHDLLGVDQSPTDRVPRQVVQRYGKALPVSAGVFSRGLARINRLTMQGRRDYALLTLAATTGRRLSELVNLNWGDVEFNEEVTVTWRRLKGGKTGRDTLPTSVGKALLDYHTAFGSYAGTAIISSTQISASPVWVSFARNGSAMRRLSTKALERICEKWFGTAKFHSLRHTFAHEMESAGAKVSDIQRRLGHASIATTGEYLAALTSDENEYAPAIAASLGID